MHYSFTFSETEPIRLDAYLGEYMPLSRSQLKRYIESGYVQVDQQIAYKKSHILKEGNIVTIDIPQSESEQLRVEAQAIDLDIRYEDDDMMIIYKAAGMVVHPGAGVRNGTIANAVAYHLHDQIDGLDPLRPGIVHRLDRGTSGLLIIAKHQRSHQLLSSMFERREIHKQYFALVSGKGLPKLGTIESPITRDSRNRLKMMVSNKPNAKSAITHFDVKQQYTWQNQFFYLLDITLITGRTHQIRVHMSAIDHPIVGDVLYGNKRVNSLMYDSFGLQRPFLHAYRLSFTHPITDKAIDIKADIPEDLQMVEKSLLNLD